MLYMSNCILAGNRILVIVLFRLTSVHTFISTLMTFCPGRCLHILVNNVLFWPSLASLS